MQPNPAPAISAPVPLGPDPSGIGRAAEEGATSACLASPLALLSTGYYARFSHGSRAVTAGRELVPGPDRRGRARTGLRRSNRW